MNTVYKINVLHMDLLAEQIAKLNKKALKLKVAPAVLTIHGEETKTFKNELTGFEFTKTFKLVTVEGETPKLDGWKLVAAIEPQESGENLVSCVPGETIPVEYRKTDTHCDHCSAIRRRKEVFVLAHEDGRFTQVGRNCISDFLGGKSPESIVCYAQWGFQITSMISSAEDEGFGGFGGGGEAAFNLDEFLKMTSAVIRKCGWVSRTVAGQLDNTTSTASTVMWLLTPHRDADSIREKQSFVERLDLKLEPHDEKLATDALAWGVALPTDDGDYLYNLGVACRLGFVRNKTSGIVASLISAYQRHMEREEELNMKRAQVAAKVRVHLGVVGERQGFAQLTIKSVKSFDSEFGVRTMIRFEDAAGSVLVWWASGDTEWEVGQTLDVTGTVKKHDEYQGIPQTILSRVAEGLPKPKKTRKKKAA
jgi:ribosomal protein L36